MAKYIDADKIKYYEHTVCCGHGDFRPVRTVSEEEIKDMPTADVVEVRHGEWVDKFNRNRMATQSFCSVCGENSGIGGIESNRHKPYCPNCGAKMDGKGEGE